MDKQDHFQGRISQEKVGTPEIREKYLTTTSKLELFVHILLTNVPL